MTQAKTIEKAVGEFGASAKAKLSGGDGQPEDQLRAPLETLFAQIAAMAWLAQVAMFLTLGLLVTPSELGPVILPGVVMTVVLMFVARPISVFLCLAPFRRFGWRSKLFVSWAGLRGAVPIVLATFPIVAGVPGAFAIFNIVFFVVLLSSVIQGPTIKWVARKLQIAAHDERVAEREGRAAIAVTPAHQQQAEPLP